MKHVRNDGRGPLLAYGHELAPGQTVEMTDDDADRLAADPHVTVTVLQEEEPEAGNGEGHKRTTNRRT